MDRKDNDGGEEEITLKEIFRKTIGTKTLTVHFDNKERGCLINIYNQKDKKTTHALMDHGGFPTFLRECGELLKTPESDKTTKVTSYDGSQGAPNYIRIVRSENDGHILINIVEDVYEKYQKMQQVTVELETADFQKIVDSMKIES